MSDSGLRWEDVDADPGQILTLLEDVYHFEVSIQDRRFPCHSFPFALKSSYFKASIASFKSSPPGNAGGLPPTLQINLSELPGGILAFESIRDFCYASKLKITEQNVLDLLSASKFLGFTEDMAPKNLYVRCRRFVRMVSLNSIQSIFTMLAHSSTNDHFVIDYEELFHRLADYACEFQDSHFDHEDEILRLLSDLAKLKPAFVYATLQVFRRFRVNMIYFFWSTGTSTTLNSIPRCDEAYHANRRSIVTYFVERLHEYVDRRGVLIDFIDPQKLVLVWTLVTEPLLSQEAIKTYVSSQLHRLKAKDIMRLCPELIQDLISTAVSASRRSARMEEEIQHLGDLADEVLLLTAERCPWDGSLDSKLTFEHMVACIPPNERESHDKLYDAVACFCRSFTQAQSAEIWNMVDPGKLSPSKVEIAINFTLAHESSYLVRLMQRRENDHTTLKRKFSFFEEQESIKRTREVSDYTGSQFTIFVRSLDGKSMCVLVQSHATIFSIKQGIEKMGSAFLERPWCLVYQGKRLLSEFLTIASYGILKDCTLCMKVLHDRERDKLIWD